MVENKPNKAPMFILRALEILISPLLLLALFMSWSSNDIWDKLDIIEIAIFTILAFVFYELTKFNHKYSKIQFDHPIANIVFGFTFGITTLLMLAAMVIKVLLPPKVYTSYHDILFVPIFFLFDLTIIIGEIKIAKQIKAEYQSAKAQEFQAPDTQ